MVGDSDGAAGSMGVESGVDAVDFGLFCRRLSCKNGREQEGMDEESHNGIATRYQVGRLTCHGD